MGDVPAYVAEWIEFLKTVDVKGPIPAKFRVIKTNPPYEQWLLQSIMRVPSRDREHPCEFCHRTYQDQEVIFQNVLLNPDLGYSKEDIILKRVLAMYQHEALESIYINNERRWDPHEGRFYSNLVVDWRLAP